MAAQQAPLSPLQDLHRLGMESLAAACTWSDPTQLSTCDGKP